MRAIFQSSVFLKLLFILLKKGVPRVIRNIHCNVFVRVDARILPLKPILHNRHITVKCNGKYVKDLHEGLQGVSPNLIIHVSTNKAIQTPMNSNNHIYKQLSSISLMTKNLIIQSLKAYFKYIALKIEILTNTQKLCT